MHLNSYYDDIDVKMGAAKAKWIDYSQKWMLYISILLSSFLSHSVNLISCRMSYIHMIHGDAHNIFDE